MSLNISNCPRCGKLFAKGIHDVCFSCVKEIEHEYELCVEYLRENRGATIPEVSEATGVSVRQITKFIREGRISFVQAPNLVYPCEACGTPIRAGNLCDNCRQKFVKQAEQIQKSLIRSDDARSKPPADSTRIAYEIKSKKPKA
jgi:flagellar operon protein (TIGR03826 family)